MLERAEVASLTRKIKVVAGNPAHGGHTMGMGAIKRMAYVAIWDLARVQAMVAM